MRCTSVLIRLLFSIYLLICSSFTIADQRADIGVYFGASIGELTLPDSQFDPDDIALSGFVGWQVTTLFGVEASYLQLGKMASDRFKLRVDAYTLAATLQYPLSSRVAVYGKVGRAWLSNDITRLIDTAKDSVDDQDEYYAIGISYELSDQFELRLSYEFFDFDFGRGLSIGPFFRDLNSDVEIISLGLMYEF